MNLDSITVRELISNAMDEVDDDGDVIGVTTVISDNPNLMGTMIPFISPMIDPTMALSNHLTMNDLIVNGTLARLRKVKVWTNEHVYILNEDNETFYVDVIDDDSVPEVMMESISV